MFCGSHQAAEVAAGMLSLMDTCKRNGVNVFDWMKDVFERILNYYNIKIIRNLTVKQIQEYKNEEGGLP
ncbi:MAG: transposase domain-containing protein [Bacteroidota bacterium]|nr:transposase domain-containing protein [Bacteroidota bacterium]